MHELPQPIAVRRAVRQTFGRVDVAQVSQGKRALIRDLQGASDKRWIIFKQPRKGVGRQERVLRIGLQPVARRVQRDAVADAGQHVLQRPACRGVVEHFGAGDERPAQCFHAVAQIAFVLDVLGAAVPRHKAIGATGESIGERGQRIL